MKKIGLIYDPVYLDHDTGSHIENVQRLTKTMALLGENALLPKLQMISPRAASVDELASIHSTEYIAKVKNIAESGGGYLDIDTIASSGSYNAAIFASGGLLSAAEAIMRHEINCAMVLARPPGHHAVCWHSMGFCIFNNIAIVAKFLQSNYDDIKRILVVDFDVHHGNGTQDVFYTDPSVLYFSTHQQNIFPGTGKINETGSKEGEGFTLNVPLFAGSGDAEFNTVYEEILAPAARKFEPDFILVSAGYDAHWADPISSLQLSVTGFSRIVEIIKTLASMLCNGRLLLALEGGYNQEALALSVAATLKKLLGDANIADPLGPSPSTQKPANFPEYIQLIKEKHSLTK